MNLIFYKPSKNWEESKPALQQLFINFPADLSTQHGHGKFKQIDSLETDKTIRKTHTHRSTEGDHQNDTNLSSWPGKYNRHFLFQREKRHGNYRNEHVWGGTTQSSHCDSGKLMCMECTYKAFMEYLDVNGVSGNIIPSTIYQWSPTRCNKSQVVCRLCKAYWGTLHHVLSA